MTYAEVISRLGKARRHKVANIRLLPRYGFGSSTVAPDV
jgi:hypothetical protein